MAFLTETEPARGIALPVLTGISRVVCRNPGVMTYHGTNTYLIEAADGLTVVDPGPDDAVHVADVLRAAGRRAIQRIVLTHTHEDHWGAAAALQESSALQAAGQAPIFGFISSARAAFKADQTLRDGDTVAGLTAVHTPGHASDHLSYGYDVPGTGQVLFSGDHVMSWSSSIVNPPDGDMVAYYHSLELLLGRSEVLYLPGHGPVLPAPRSFVASLLAHRQMREAGIVAALQRQEWAVAALAAQLYAKTDQLLKLAAERNVLAHLLKLQHDGVVAELDPEDAALDDAPAGDDSKMSEQIRVMRRDGRRRFMLRRDAGYHEPAKA